MNSNFLNFSPIVLRRHADPHPHAAIAVAADRRRKDRLGPRRQRRQHRAATVQRHLRGVEGWNDDGKRGHGDSYAIPNSAITFFISAHTSFFADGVRRR